MTLWTRSYTLDKQRGGDIDHTTTNGDPEGGTISEDREEKARDEEEVRGSSNQIGRNNPVDLPEGRETPRSERTAAGLQSHRGSMVETKGEKV